MCNHSLAVRASGRVGGLHLLKLWGVSAAESFHTFHHVSACVCVHCLSVYRDDFSYDGTMNHMMLAQE